MNRDLNSYKNLLIEEKTALEKDLQPLAESKAPGEWETAAVDAVDTADREDVANSIEEYVEKNETVKILETQLNEVLHALQKIEDGTYGTCEACGAEIEADRLNANPSARTCKACMNTTN